MSATLSTLTIERIEAARALLKAARMQDAIIARLDAAQADSTEAEVATEELEHLVSVRGSFVDRLTAGAPYWAECIASATRVELECVRAFASEAESILQEIQSIDQRTESLLVARRIDVSDAIRKSGNAALALRAYGPATPHPAAVASQFTDTQV